MSLVTDGRPTAEVAASCRLVRNDVALITAADEAIVDVLGWQPEQLIGMPSTGLIHPDDQASAVAAWFEMIAAPGATKTWRGRYRAADGRWQWVESVNTNHLDDPGAPRVLSVLRRITVSQMSIEEELRARKQILIRLAEALPVGVFQIDRDHQMTFSNGRLHDILGVPPAADVSAQFAVIVSDDRALLDAALSSAMHDQPVDDLELRFGVQVPHPEFSSTRVCQISLRPLTDGSGTVTGVIGCLTDVTDSVELRRELEIRAAVDGLTGCLNRTATFELLDLSLRQVATSEAGLAVIFIDLDHFKAVNDQFGHAAGDQALSVAAERIRAVTRAGDSVGRIGGDEFVVICPNVTSGAASLPLAQRINETLQTFLSFGKAEIELSASIGLAWTNQAASSPDALIARADAAMYQAKTARSGEVALAP